MRVLMQKPLCFEIEKDVLRKHDRLDAHFLHPRYLELEKRVNVKYFSQCFGKDISQ